MPVKVYKCDGSPPARSLMMGCGIFDVPAEMVDVDFLARENYAADYVKKNPLHSVPMLEDGDFCIIDSHAALQYLAQTYGKDDSWYPKDPKQRAQVDEKLFFDTAILYPRIRNFSVPLLIKGEKSIPQENLDLVTEAYDFLEEFLTRHKYIALDQPTIADIAAFASVSSLDYILPVDAKKYPKTAGWMKELSQKPFAKKFNEPGLTFLGGILKAKVQEILQNQLEINRN